jgi:hypothetical protein
VRQRRRKSVGIAVLFAACALAIPASAGAAVNLTNPSGASLVATLDQSASNIVIGGSSDASVTLTELSVSGPVFAVPPLGGAVCQGAATQQITCTSGKFGSITVDDDRGPGPPDVVNGSDTPAHLLVAPTLPLIAPITLIGSPFGDFLGGSIGGDKISGGPGADEITARGGADSVEAFDGVADSVDCGDGTDSVKADSIDTLVNCEQPLVVVDSDGDGFSTEEDCNDKDETVYPDAVEIPGNDRDEDCDGKDDSPPVDLIDRDSDNDGIAEPEDCDDRDAKIRPGALEIVGNRVDENCDGRIEPFPSIGSSIHSAFRIVGGNRTRVVDMTVTDIPQGATIQLTCLNHHGSSTSSNNGCPFSKQSFGFGSGPRQTTDLAGSFKKRKLKPGVVITVTISAPDAIGKRVQYKTRKGKEPRVSSACVPPEGGLLDSGDSLCGTTDHL